MHIDYENELQLANIKKILQENYPEEKVVRFCGDVLSKYTETEDKLGNKVNALKAIHRKLQIIDCDSILTKGMTGGDVDFVLHFPQSIHGKDVYTYLEWKVDNGTNKFDKEYETNKQFLDYKHIIDCNTVTRDSVVFLLYREDKLKIPSDCFTINGILIKGDDLSKQNSTLIHDFDGLTLLEFVMLWKGEKIRISLSKDMKFFHGTLIPNGCTDQEIISRPGGIRISPVYMYNYTGEKSVSNRFVNNVIELEDLIAGRLKIKDYDKYLFPANLSHIFDDCNKLCYKGKLSNRNYDYGIYPKIGNRVYDLDYHFKWNDFDKQNEFIFYQKLKEIVEQKLNRNKFKLYEVLP